MVIRQKFKNLDLVGQVFGALTVLEKVEVRNKNQKVTVYRCACTCGEVAYVRPDKFFHKQKPTKSCKKCGVVRMAAGRILPDHMSIKKRVFRHYKYGAKTRNYSFTLNFTEFLKLINSNCHYCGKEPEELDGDKQDNFTGYPFKRNGIDRKCNSIGYEINNVVPCCAQCNRAKLDMDYIDFIDLIHRCYNHLGKQSSTTIP